MNKEGTVCAVKIKFLKKKSEKQLRKKKKRFLNFYHPLFLFSLSTKEQIFRNIILATAHVTLSHVCTTQMHFDSENKSHCRLATYWERN